MRAITINVVLICVSSMIGGGIVEAFRGKLVIASDRPAGSLKRVVAEEFRLVDSNGSLKALLSTLDDGAPTLAFFNQKKCPIALTGRTEGGLIFLTAKANSRQGVRLSAEEGKEIIEIRGTDSAVRGAMTMESGNPCLHLNKGNVNLQMHTYDTSGLMVLEHKTGNRFMLTVGDESSLMIGDKELKNGIALLASSDNTYAQIMRDGKAVWSEPINVPKD